MFPNGKLEKVLHIQRCGRQVNSIQGKKKLNWKIKRVDEQSIQNSSEEVINEIRINPKKFKAKQ